MTSDVPAPDVIGSVSGPKPALLTGAGVRRISLGELILIGATAVASVVAVTVLSRNGWFFGDAWDFLATRDLSTVDGWLKPHNGHLQVPAVVIYQALYATVGLEYFPWYPLARAIGYAGMVTWMWYVMRRRGADPWITGAATLLLLLLGTGGFLTAAGFGNFAVLSLALALPPLLTPAAPGQAARREWVRLLALTLVLLLLVASSSLGIAIAGGAFIVSIVGRMPKSNLIPFAAAFLAYGAWYLGYRVIEGEVVTAFASPVVVPGVAFEIMRGALARLTDLTQPPLIGMVLAAALIAGVAFLAWQRRFDLFDSVFLLALPIYLAMVGLVRVGTGTAAVGSSRYAYNVILLLAPVLVPKLRPRHWWVTVPVVTTLVVMAGLNLRQLESGIRYWNAHGAAGRIEIETAAALIARGEPVVNGALLRGPASRRLAADALGPLLDDGWGPPLSGSREVVEQMRAGLRMRRSLDIESVGVSPLAPGVTSRCIKLERAASQRLVVEDHGTVTIHPQRHTRLAMTWVDEFGAGRWSFSLRKPHMVELADPVTTATVTIEVLGPGPVRVCGLDPAPAGT